MKFVKLFMDTGYVDGDGSRTMYFVFDSNESKRVIADEMRECANEFFDDHRYLADGYDYDYVTEFANEEDEEAYYDNCYYEYDEIDKESLLKELEDVYGSVEDAEVWDDRDKERDIEWR